MTSKQWTSLESLIRELTDRLDKMERRSEKMELILMVREPGSTAAADAYDGLRKQIIAGVTDRLAHLTQLVQFDAAVRNQASPKILSSMVQGWLDASGLAIVTDSEHGQRDLLFEVVENLGGPPEVLEPSYVDAQSNRVIRRGKIRFGPPVRGAAPPTPEEAVLPTVSRAVDISPEPIAQDGGNEE